MVAFLYSLHASKCSFSLLFGLPFLLKDWNPPKINHQAKQYTRKLHRNSWKSAAACSVTENKAFLNPSSPLSLLRLASATVCPSLVSMPSTSRGTCSSTPWRATAQTLSSTWRWARHVDHAWNCDKTPRVWKSAAHNRERKPPCDMLLLNTNRTLQTCGASAGMTGYFWLHLVFLSLQALSTDSIERLPVYNKTALKNYKVSQEADDWCIPSKEPLDLSNYKVAKWNCPPGLVLQAYIPWRLQNFCLHIPMSSSVKADVGTEPFTTERVISRLKQTKCPLIFQSGFSSSMFMLSLSTSWVLHKKIENKLLTENTCHNHLWDISNVTSKGSVWGHAALSHVQVETEAAPRMLWVWCCDRSGNISLNIPV